MSALLILLLFLVVAWLIRRSRRPRPLTWDDLFVPVHTRRYRRNAWRASWQGW